MITEKFTLIFFGIDSKYYTNEFVAHLWEESADKEYKRCGIYVTARKASCFIRLEQEASLSLHPLLCQYTVPFKIIYGQAAL